MQFLLPGCRSSCGYTSSVETSCYRCGAALEEGSPFCPSCNAPQIKVTAPQRVANEPFVRPPAPGIPNAIPPELPTADSSQRGEVEWKRYRRVALPLSLVAGLGIAFYPPLGLLFFVGAIVYAVSRYAREHPGPLRASHGAKMGAVSGFISFIVIAVVAALQEVLNFDEYRQQVLVPLQKRLADNPDPRMQQFVHWVGTNQGFITMSILSLCFLLVVFLIVSSFIGAVSVSFAANRNRR